MSIPVSLNERSCNGSPEVWRLLRTPPLPAALNMALDEILLGAVANGRSQQIFRLYRWAPPAVSIGYAQSPADVNTEMCRRLGYDIVRRFTGGRAVLHANECTYAVIAHTGLLFPASITGSYRVIAGVLQQALLSLGLPVELAAGRRRTSQSGICFTAPAFAELLCAGCKIAGSAQKRRGGAFLQHGSIPVDLDLALLSQVLGTGSDSVQMDSASLIRSVGWLNRFLPAPVSITEVEETLIAAFSAALPVRFLADEPTHNEWEAARQLALTRYNRLR